MYMTQTLVKLVTDPSMIHMSRDGRGSLETVLTDGADDVSEQCAIPEVSLQLDDECLVTRLVQVVVGPVCVDLHHT